MNEHDKQNRREEYLRKLRDPRWQRKRLEIMQRDEFTCQYCYDTQTTLNVHHNYYQSDREPWDYPEAALITLCENCHTEETENRRSEEVLLLHVCRTMGLSSSGVNGLAIALHDLGEHSMFSEHWQYDLTWFIRHFWEIRDFIDPLRAEVRRRAEELKAKESKA